MDNTIILYFIKASVSLAFFYVLYILLLKGDTFFKLRRGYFLFAIFFSLMFPFLSIEIMGKGEVNTPIPAYWLSQLEIEEIVVNQTEAATGSDFINVWTIVSFAVISVSVILVVKFLMQLLSIVKLRIDNESEVVRSYRIIKLSNKKVSPFSFFRWIFINEEIHDEAELNEIIAHEQVHVKQYHSIDVVLAEILCICFWWNPFVWLMRNELKINLEYLADEGVVQAGFDTKAYQYILLQASKRNTGIPIINNFNVSQLKKRITMMNKKRTTIGNAAKYMLAIPLCFLLLLGNAAQSTNELINLIPDDFPIINSSGEGINQIETNGNESEKPTETAINTPKKEKTGNVPTFPGGEEALFKFVRENLKYPIEAQEKGETGYVEASFTIKKTGKIEDVNVSGEGSDLLKKEAKRIIESMPSWTTGNADTEYVLPFLFRLKGKTEEDTNIPQRENMTVVIAMLGGKQGARNEQNNQGSPSVDAVDDEDPPFVTVETMPTYPGGEKEMSKFISENMKYPIKAQEAGIQGKTTVRFVVDKTGKITNATVLRGFDPDCDKEALRVINSMPKWIPGKQKGQAVPVYFTLPFTFKLNKNVKETAPTASVQESNEVIKISVATLKEERTEKDGGDVYLEVEQLPTFPGGDKEMAKFISENMKYPIKAQEAGIGGKVVVGFVVSKTGEIGEVKLVRSIDADCDAEAMRVVKAMPKWIPGKHAGKDVNVIYMLPLTFKLNK